MGKKEIIEEFVLATNKLKNENTSDVIIEELNFFNMDDIKTIESKTNLNIVKGIKTLTLFLPLILKKIYKHLNEDLKEEEILIIGDEEQSTKEIIERLYKDVRFITLAGDYDNIIENISKEMMEKYGLSIFYSKKVDNILTNYSIIINLKDNYYFDMDKLRNKAIIFDFSISKVMKNQKTKTKKAIIIEDFMFKIDHIDIADNNFLNSLIPSYVYEQFNRLNSADFASLSIDGKFYNIQNFADDQIKIEEKL